MATTRKKHRLSELILYNPVKDKIHTNDVTLLYYEMYGRKRKVDIVKVQVMEHLEGVEQARYYVEQVQKEVDVTGVGIQLDPTVKQENADCEEEIMSEDPAYQHIHPEHVADERLATSTIHAKI